MALWTDPTPVVVAGTLTSSDSPPNTVIYMRPDSVRGDERPAPVRPRIVSLPFTGKSARRLRLEQRWAMAKLRQAKR